MKAVILAAGQGRRLAPMGWGKPKCLLPWGSCTLLDFTLQSILGHAVRDIVIVVGYQRDLVIEAARQHPANCEFVVNEDYAITNTIHSLWLARQYLNEGFLYFNADVMFESALISLLLQQSSSALAVEVKPCGAEEVKVVADASGRITRIGKALPPEVALGEFIGVAKFGQLECPSLIASLRCHNEELGRRNCFFESALADILDRHVFMATPLGRLKAMEIDTPEDYSRAKSLWPSCHGSTGDDGPKVGDVEHFETGP